jgi:hypothetical protein
MDRKNAWGIGIMFLLMLPFLFLSGCRTTTGTLIGNTSPGASAYGNPAKNQYRYYPYDRVYFDEQRKVYYYNSEGNWQMSVSLPSSIRITVDDFVKLDMDTDKPYEYHNDVVRKYPPGQEKKKDQDMDNNKDEYQTPDKYQVKKEDNN